MPQVSVDTGGHAIAHRQTALQHLQVVKMVVLGFGGIGNVGAAGGTDQHPAIPYLAATLAIKGRAIQNGDALFTGLQGVNRIAVLDQGGNGCRALGTLVTGKDRLAWNTDRLVVIDLEAAAPWDRRRCSAIARS